MLLNIAIVLLLALFCYGLLEKLKLPGLIATILLGIYLGPGGIDFLNPNLLRAAPQLRIFALMIILLRAGLGLERKSLDKIGSCALRLSFIPALLEGLVIAFASTYLLGFSFIQGGIIGFIVAASSPAVIVPEMLALKKQGLGDEIPSLVLAGAAADDVVAITQSMYWGTAIAPGLLALSTVGQIILGIILGVLVGLLLAWFFRRFETGNTQRVIILICVAILFYSLEEFIPMASLLGVMAMGVTLRDALPHLAKGLSSSLEGIWDLAKLFLFLLIGSSLELSLVWGILPQALILIIVGLLARGLGVMVSTQKSTLNMKERLFCVVAYLPKATVQAAIGAVPLGAGVAGGNLMLAISAIAILITAPIGAIGIRLTAPMWLAEARPRVRACESD